MGEATPVVSYVIRTFPKLSESFVVRELLALQRAGLPVEIWSLLPAGEEDIAAVPAAAPLLPLIRSVPRGPLGLVRLFGDLAAVAARRPLQTLAAFGWALTWSLRERDARHLAALPYAAHLARRAAAPHLHAHFANTPATTAILAARLSGPTGHGTPGGRSAGRRAARIRRTVSYTGHARDLWVMTSPAFLAEKTRRCTFAVSGTKFAIDHIRVACATNGSGPVPTLEVVTNSVDLPAIDGGDPAGAAAHRGDRATQGSSVAGGPVVREPGLVATTARLVEKKGVDLVIRAAAQLAPERPDLRLEIVGDGPLREELEALAAELGLGSRVLFHGPLPFDAVGEVLRRASVFALPARTAQDGDTDGLPVAILEALAYGLPVVATPTAGIPEAVLEGRTGLIVAPNDVNATAAALRALLTDDALRARLGAAGRDLVAERFDARRSAQQLAGLFRGD